MIIDPKRKAAMIERGHGDKVALVEKDLCPFCGKPVKEEDFAGNAIQLNERKISGLCHWCQLDYFLPDGTLKPDIEKLCVPTADSPADPDMGSEKQ